MTRETLKTYDGIDLVVANASLIGLFPKVSVYINFDEEKVKVQKENDSDRYLTDLIRPCSKAEVMDIIIKMLSY